MKRRLLFFTLLLAALPLRSLAYDFFKVAPTGQMLYYNIVNGAAVVTYPGTGSGSTAYWSTFTRPTGALIIPDSVVSGTGVKYAVTSIGEHAFYGCSGLTTPNTYW